jgi:hypothetical protein
MYEELVGAVERELRDDLAPWLFAQVVALDPEPAAALVRRVIHDLAPDSWTTAISDAVIKSWRELARQTVLAAVEALPPGRTRIEALCRVATALSPEQRREAFDGLLAGVSPSTFQAGKMVSNAHLHEQLLATIPEAWRDEWIAHELRHEDSPNVWMELLARRTLGHWPPPDHRLWREVERDLDHCSVFTPHFPPALRERARSRARAGTRPRMMLAELGDDLTADECLEVVGTPAGQRPRVIADHLRKVRPHLGGVPTEVRRAWLDAVVAFDDGYAMQSAIAWLVDALDPGDRERAVAASVASAIESGYLYGDDVIVRFAEPARLAAVLEAVVRQRTWCGWFAEAIIAARDLATQTRCFAPLLERHADFDPARIADLVIAMAPWLSAHTQRAFPRRVAERWL